MRKIFEDLLDNIENADSQVQRPSTDVAPEQLYDYILYVGHQTNAGRGDTKRELYYFDLCLEDLKGVMDICLDSYETDGILYFQEDDDYRWYHGTKKLPDDELKRMSSGLGGMACYKVYFNFDPDIIKMLRFFYTVANRFNAWGSHSL